MKKLFQYVLLLLIALAYFWVPTESAQAQVTLSTQAGPNFSLTNTVYPTYRYPLGTVTGNGTAKLNIGSVSTVTCRVTGTYTVASTAIQVSNDNTNFTTIAWLPVGGGSSVTSITANGLYQANLGGGMTQMQFNNTGTFTGTSQIFNCSGSATLAMDVAGYDTLPADPCQDKTIGKLGVAINISTATTTQLVAPVAGQKIYVCNVFALEGASQVITFQEGTGATCGTGTVNMTGAMTAAATAGTTEFEMFLLRPTVVGNGVCVVSGAAVAFTGIMTYVQE